MRILAALKWVALRPEVDPLTGIAHPDPRFSGAGPADTSALEWALRLRDALGGTVTAVTVGPPPAEALLRQALAVGVDHAVRVDLAGDHHAGVDPAHPSSRWVAAELAAVAAGSDLVLCGYASPDRGSGAVPAFLAHELGWPQALGLTGLVVEPAAGGGGDRGAHRLVLERRLDGGRRERLALMPPGVLSLEPGPELRRAPLAATLTAGSALIDVQPARHVPPPSPAMLARRPYRPRARVVAAPGGDTRSRLVNLLGAAQLGVAHGGGEGRAGGEVSPADAARLVLERLAAWGYLDAQPESDVPARHP
ncbi:MAG: mycofactocin-associated electron transfer flavoprotein beta subunit [Acidimicrobiales bacterium]